MRKTKLILAALGALAALALLPVAAQANSPWWRLSSSARPSNLAPEAKGELILSVANLGDAAADGNAEPIVIEDHLPAGLKALSVEAIAGQPEGETGERGPVKCTRTASLATCTFAGTYVRTISNAETVAKTLPPYDQFEVRIRVQALPGAHSGEVSEASVTGGLAPPAQLSSPIAISGEPTPFGLESYELGYEEPGGKASTQAGSHPFQQTVVLSLKEDAPSKANGYHVVVPALAKDVHTKLPPGLLGNPKPFEICSLAQFLTVSAGGLGAENLCPASTAVGVTTIAVDVPAGLFIPFTVPVFNLEPTFGEPARFGFVVPATPVVIDTAVRGGGPGEPQPDYGVTASGTNISQTATLLTSTITFWGTPGDPRHDNSRGWGCMEEARDLSQIEPCIPSSEAHPPALLTLPTNCSGPLQSSTLIDSWLEPHNQLLYPASPPLGSLDGCANVPFEPEIHSEPTSNAATSPTGFKFDLGVHDEGLLSDKGIAQSEIKKAIVTLPQGFTTNPSVAEGLKACSEEAFEATTVEAGNGCPAESKVGSVEAETPLVKQKLTGALYVAKQGENPFHSLLTLYMVIRNPELGVLIKIAGKVEPNPVTGQLTTTFDNLPQLPISHFHLEFRSGQRSPLVTPPACGTYAVQAVLFPWSDPSHALERESPFQIEAGPEGQPCPSGGLPPFHPELLAGSINNRAGSFSPFDTRITRHDSEQEITHFSIKLPPGVIGKLAGVAECSDAQIAAAKAREHEGGGQEELDDPSCPASSEVGRSLVGSGVGNVLAYAPGKIYLAGPYHGSNLSMVAITAAKVGPFDLGTVVVRFALRINPETAEVFVDATGSDPIPHIVDGIPVHLRDVRAYVDRPEFVLNPTDCTPTSTASTVLGSGLDFASEADDNPITVTSRFQAADCAALRFKPQLSLRLVGGTKRGAHPALRSHLAMNGIGEAGIGFAEVILPHSEFIENAHFNNICTRVQFKAGPGNGAECPAGSIYGHAKAITPLLSEPLEGPIMLRSNPERKLPDVVAALHNSQVDFDLVGNVDGLANGELRTTFPNAPDAPVSSFDLELEGAAKGLFVNSTDLCARKHSATVNFTGQNGKISDLKPVLQVKCPKSRKHKAHKRPARRHRGR